MLKLRYIHVGENSEPKPESDVTFKKVSVLVSKNLVLKKRVSIGIENIWSQKSLGISLRWNFWSRNLVVPCHMLKNTVEKYARVGEVVVVREGGNEYLCAVYSDTNH